jgi:hypothetical protein
MSQRSFLPVIVAALALAAANVIGAFAQVQSKGQQACVNGLNRAGAAVAKAQGREHLGCVRSAGKGTLVGPAQACLTADAKGKVAKASAKTVTAETKSCGTAPDYGYVGATAVNAAAKQADLDLVADVYGADLGAAVIACATNGVGCTCQQKVSKGVEALAAVKLATFVACKRAALRAGATSAAALAACVGDGGTSASIAADKKGKIAKLLAKLSATVTNGCGGTGATSGAYPGACGAATGPALAACLDRQVECRVCQAINESDGLAVSCDLFDDGLANATCASGGVPTPTPTPTSAPGVVLKGSLGITYGRFNYNLMLGIPGANSACNSHFAGTHACTYAELQSAEAAGDLDGLIDVEGNTVLGFWAIDASLPALQQCNDDSMGGSNLNWEYGTSHTGSRGSRVALDNGAGTLGPLVTGVQCNTPATLSWVGCCQ